MPEYDLLFALGGATGAVTVVASSNHARDIVDTVLGRPGWRSEGDDPSSPPVWKIVLTPANARSELAAAAIKQGLRVAEITADDVVPYVPVSTLAGRYLTTQSRCNDSRRNSSCYNPTSFFRTPHPRLPHF